MKQYSAGFATCIVVLVAIYLFFIAGQELVPDQTETATKPFRKAHGQAKKLAQATINKAKRQVSEASKTMEDQVAQSKRQLQAV